MDKKRSIAAILGLLLLLAVFFAGKHHVFFHGRPVEECPVCVSLRALQRASCLLPLGVSFSFFFPLALWKILESGDQAFFPRQSPVERKERMDD